MIKRLGFPCKWIDTVEQIDGGIKPNDDAKKYQTGTTTVAWLNRQTKDVAVEKLWYLVKNNIRSAHLLVERVGALDEHLRIVRLGSDMLPVYTQADWRWFWQEPDVRAYAEKHFAEVGRIARERNVKLSMHPGQFTVLASVNEGIVGRSIEEMEYHADLARWMGYGRQFQDFKINIHISGRQGPAGILAALPRLSPEARNCITIENDENNWGIDASLELEKHCALVLDIHHFWCREGEYIYPSDDRYKRVIDSWRGVRPTIHYSYSRNEHLPNGFLHDVMPDMKTLLNSGHKKQKLRAHSDFYPNRAMNEYALSFLDTSDIMCESKSKNIGSFALYDFWKSLK